MVFRLFEIAIIRNSTSKQRTISKFFFIPAKKRQKLDSSKINRKMKMAERCNKLRLWKIKLMSVWFQTVYLLVLSCRLA